MENAGIILKVVLRVIPAFLIGALWWLIPYWGFLAYGYANVMPVIGLSIIWLFSMLFVLTAILEELPDEIGAPFFIGIVVNFLFWVSLIFTNTYTNSNDTLIREVDGRAEVVQVTSERLYPFWNNDFQRITQTSGGISYAMDTRCETGICKIKAEVGYRVDNSFVAEHADVLQSYGAIADSALTASIIKDEARTIPELEAAFCDNFLEQAHLRDPRVNEDIPCPLRLRIGLSVEQSMSN